MPTTKLRVMVIQEKQLEKLCRTLNLDGPVEYFMQFLDLKERAITRHKGGSANEAWKTEKEDCLQQLKQRFGLPLVRPSCNPLTLNAWKRWQTLLEMAILFDERDTRNSRGAGNVLWPITLPIPISVNTEGFDD